MNKQQLFNLEENGQEKIIKSLTKSDIYLYEQCPLKLWKKHKNPENYKFKITNKNTLIGIRAHELIKKKIEKKYSDKKSVKFSSKIYDAAVKFEAKKIAEEFIYFLENELIEKGEVIGAEEKMEMNIDELGIKLKGIMDLLVIKESQVYGTYVHVIDFKRKHIKQYLDNEALLYAFLVSEAYGLPVLFERVSIEDKKTFQYFFYLNDLLEARKEIVEYLQKILKELETEESPVSNPSVENCLECPFYKECIKNAQDSYEKIKMEGIKNPEFLVKTIQELKTIEVFRRELENDLKQYLIENDLEELNFEKFGVEVKLNTSRYASLGRKVKKAEIAPKLLKENLIPEEKYPLLLLKTDDFLEEIKEAFDLDDKDIKFIERKTLSIKIQNKKKEKKNA